MVWVFQRQESFNGMNLQQQGYQRYKSSTAWISSRQGPWVWVLSSPVSVVTENRDSEDAHSFDSIVIREMGNLSLENTQSNESEDSLYDDISDLSTDDTLRNTAAEENFTQTQVGSNASNVRQSPTQERPDHSNQYY